ncbi:hypothetical protein EDB81DRAFT_788170, partial [Dactylonectria macrodidyma]
MSPWNVFFFLVSASEGFSANARPLCSTRLLVPWSSCTRPYKSRHGPVLQYMFDLGVTFANRTILNWIGSYSSYLPNLYLTNLRPSLVYISFYP